MIDLHNHILPGIDDGARDMEESLEMARQAVAAGTQVMAATPHRFWRAKPFSTERIATYVERLQAELDRQTIGLRIVPGCEIPMWPDPIDALQEGTIMRLGGEASRAVLVEPPFDRIPGNALRLLAAMQEIGLMPVLAHPERNREAQGDLSFVEACAETGIALQITSGSILGHFGREPRRVAHAIATRSDWRVIIASDSHWAHDRTPAHMGAARDTVAG